MSFEPHPVAWTDEQVARLWDFYGSHPLHQASFFSYQFREHIIQTISRHLPLKGRQVLDYGCGPGHLLEALGQRGIECSGLDFSLQSVETARERLKALPSIRQIEHVAELPSAFPEGSFDLVICVEVVEHLQDHYLEPTLAELYRLCRPGGIVYVSTPNRENLDGETTMCPECGAVFHRWQHVRNWTPETLSYRMESYGFRTLACKGTRFVARPGSIRGRAHRLLAGLAGQRPHLYYFGQKPG